ncbi:MAG: esterase, partial [Bacteroidaceae bacterium]|nr:esterase [Bacteroidaceae bacterium]
MKKLFLAAIAACFSLASFAQQALWSGESVVSPDIHADNTVTFRYRAPKAVKVQVTGDFLPSQLVEIPNMNMKMEAPGVADLKEGKDGVWEFTTEKPLDPELYSYSFIVDGLKVMDPANVYMNRDVASVTNIFIISKSDGDKGDLYSVNDVPHGTVSRIWYNSPTLNMNRRLTVYTPAGYETSKQKYPVFYLLHGAGGDEEAW